MPYMENDNLHVHYQLDGVPGAPCLILSNSLGTNLDMWAPQMPALLKHFRVLCYDTRGHGRSGVTPGPYTIAQLGEDVIALMDHLDIERAHFCGLSMGGMIGMWLGAHHPSRLDRLVLCNTAARIGPPELWNARIQKVNAEGMASIAPAVIDRWFTKAFQQTELKIVAPLQRMLAETPAEGYTACCAAVRDMDQRDSLEAITVPTLVIVGTQDQATPPEDGRLVAERIPGACYVEFDAAHLSNWETAEPFTDNLVGFLKQGE
jgi:3-oxoadipate enol-lactonase